MANLITLSRLLLLLLVVVLAYQLPPSWQVLNVVLLIVTFATDGFDGYVARKRNEESQFGAMFDIASDRIVELTLWIVLTDLDLVPLWVLLLFIIRGAIVDAIRSTQAAAHRSSPFSMMKSSLGRWLVAGKSMRIGYAVVKAVTFCWLILSLALPALLSPHVTNWVTTWEPLVGVVSITLIHSSAALCVARGLPVVAEFVHAERDSLLGSLARPSSGSLH